MAKPTTTNEIGAKLLKESFSDLAGSRTVRRAVGAAQLVPEARIDRYLERLQRVLARRPEKSGIQAPYARLAERLIKKSCLDLSNAELVDRIARGIYESEKRGAFQQGHGGALGLSQYDSVRDKYISVVSEKYALQRETLGGWTSYLHENNGHYPAWFRYLAVRGVLKMGEYNRDIPSFHKRTDNTIAPFPELSPEALGLVYKVLADRDEAAKIIESLDPFNIDPFRQALDTKRFANLYAVALRECNKSIDRSRLEGEWRKYEQGSDHKILEQDLSGKGTGWCTATGAAKQHLKGGDFYVYYTKDSNEQFTVPRVAIRMANDKIAEMRGIARGQAMESELVEIAEEKGKKLPGFERFKKASVDMKRLAEFDKRCFTRNANLEIIERHKPELSKEDLLFLLEVHEKIVGFGYGKDPRIAEIRASLESIPAGMVFDGDVDFGGCTSLTSIPEGTLFGGSANFEGCSSLKSISRGTKFIGPASFKYCHGLQSLGEDSIFKDSAVFEGCTSLETIPRGIVFKGDANFRGCTSLLRIEGKITFGGRADFEGCGNLQAIFRDSIFTLSVNFNDCNLQFVHPSVRFHSSVWMQGCHEAVRGKYELR